MKAILKKCLKFFMALFLIGIAAITVLSFIPIPVTVKTIEANPNTRYWTMQAGYRIAYQKIASTIPHNQAPVIFLHGGPGGYIHSETIRAFSPISDDGRNLYFYDQSGTGLSDRRERPKDTTLQGHIDDLYQIVTAHIKAEKVVIIGHSYGAQIATGFAVQHPELIERLVLSSPGDIDPVEFNAQGEQLNSIRYPTPSNLHFRSVEKDKSLTEISAMPVRGVVSLMIGTMFNTKFAPDKEVDNALNTMASRFTTEMVCDPHNVKPEEGGGGMYSRIGSNFFEDSDNPRPLMPGMKSPVLVLQGACDFIPYSDAYEYVALFPNARYQFIPDAGHIIWWDQPEAYLQSIQQFIKAP